MQRYITIKELCAMFGFGRTTAYALLRLNLIEGVLLGSRRLICLESVEKFFASLKKKGGV